MKVTVESGINLALIKYWGKDEKGLPLTSSLGLTLSPVATRTTVRLSTHDALWINGEREPLEKALPVFGAIRAWSKENVFFEVRSENFFPTAAGLASSSSGFAALALGCISALEEKASLEEISTFAGIGSKSAARAVFDGYSLLLAGKDSACKMEVSPFWNEVCVFLFFVSYERKTLSSSSAMRLISSSPYAQSWKEDSALLFSKARAVLEQEEGANAFERLGESIRLSYTRMHAVCLSYSPPLFYFDPQSIELIKQCAALRAQGILVYETMDAGPQVKVLVQKKDEREVWDYFKKNSRVPFLIAHPGKGVRVL